VAKPPESEQVTAAKRLLMSYDYVVLKRVSYQRGQQRIHVAEAVCEYAEQANLGTQRWARGLCDQINFLRDRVSYLYGAAIEAGATPERLSGPNTAVLTELDAIDTQDQEGPE
jgi:hypothetical protein